MSRHHRHPHHYWGKDRRSQEERERDWYTGMVIATAPMMPHPLPCEATARRLGLPPPDVYEILAEIERLKPEVEEARRLHFEMARENAPEGVKRRWEAMRKVEVVQSLPEFARLTANPNRPRKL